MMAMVTRLWDGEVGRPYRVRDPVMKGH
jgi:hypothetical protein